MSSNNQEESVSVDREIFAKSIALISSLIEQLEQDISPKSREKFEQLQLQIKRGISELEQTESLLYQTQDELQKYQNKFNQNQKKLKLYESNQRRLKWELYQSQSLLYQAYQKLDESQSRLRKNEIELQETKSQKYQLQQQVDFDKKQLHQNHNELEKINAQLNCYKNATKEQKIQRKVTYDLLVWEAWYAYESGDTNKMADYLQKSLKYTPFSRTKTISNWLNTFADLCSFKGKVLNTYSLTKLPVWKQLLSRTLKIKPLKHQALSIKKSQKL